MKFHLTADCLFEADSLNRAVLKLARHMLELATEEEPRDIIQMIAGEFNIKPIVEQRVKN